MKELEHALGKLTVYKNDFTNCGVHHKRHSDGSITLDQDEYIKTLIPIKHPDLSNAPSTPASEELLLLYRSLLGAVSYVQLTQHQMSCYIVALQKVTRKLTVEDVKKLNVVVNKLKASPATLTFRPLGTLEQQEHLTVFSDAGFKKEQVDGYALRGGLYLRHAEPIYQQDGTKVNKDINCHVILAESKSINTVSRSTYAAELMSAAAAVDMMIPLSVTLHEIRNGPLEVEHVKNLKTFGWNNACTLRTSIMIDAKSVYESLRASLFKPPVENSLAGHVLWLREIHDLGLLQEVVWTDTRDMYADGLTKGAIKRDALYETLSGIVRLRHPVAVCTRRRLALMRPRTNVTENVHPASKARTHVNEPVHYVTKARTHVAEPKKPVTQARIQGGNSRTHEPEDMFLCTLVTLTDRDKQTTRNSWKEGSSLGMVSSSSLSASFAGSLGNQVSRCTASTFAGTPALGKSSRGTLAGTLALGHFSREELGQPSWQNTLAH